MLQPTNQTLSSTFHRMPCRQYSWWQKKDVLKAMRITTIETALILVHLKLLSDPLRRDSIREHHCLAWRQTLHTLTPWSSPMVSPMVTAVSWWVGGPDTHQSLFLLHTSHNYTLLLTLTTLYHIPPSTRTKHLQTLRTMMILHLLQKYSALLLLCVK